MKQIQLKKSKLISNLCYYISNSFLTKIFVVLITNIYHGLTNYNKNNTNNKLKKKKKTLNKHENTNIEDFVLQSTRPYFLSFTSDKTMAVVTSSPLVTVTLWLSNWICVLFIPTLYNEVKKIRQLKCLRGEIWLAKPRCTNRREKLNLNLTTTRQQQEAKRGRNSWTWTEAKQETATCWGPIKWRL